MTGGSCLYIGTVMHRRLRPLSQRFRYRVYWLYTDLEELPALGRRLLLFSYNRPNLFSLDDRDHGDGSRTSLAMQARQKLRDAGIEIGCGRIMLLCMPRCFGYSFNPLSIYFCHRDDGALAALIYQVHNTFGERHSYVLPAAGDDVLRQMCQKTFRVSPFMDMELRYAFRVAYPRDRVAVGIAVHDARGPVLCAALEGSRRALNDRALIRVGIGIPAVTLKVIATIHWQALKLWCRGLRFTPRAGAAVGAPPRAGYGAP